MTVSLECYFNSKCALDEVIDHKISALKIFLLPFPPSRVNDHIDVLILSLQYNIEYIVKNRSALRHFDEWSGKRLDYSRAMIVRLRRLKTEFTIPF